MQDGLTIWLSGPSECPKDELAQHIEGLLLERGLDSELLDDKLMWKEFGPQAQTPSDNEKLIARRSGLIASMLTRNRAFPIVSVHVPSKQERANCFGMQNRSIEVLCTGSGNGPEPSPNIVENSTRRAVHQIPFESSDKFEVEINTNKEGFEAAARKVLMTLELLGALPKNSDSVQYDPEEANVIRKRLEDLGYI